MAADILGETYRTSSGGLSDYPDAGLTLDTSSFGNSYTGAYAAYSTFDAADPYPNNGTIDRVFTVPANTGIVGVSISWVGRGDYTKAQVNASASSVIGSDMDVYLLNPSGTLVATSASFDNSTETLWLNSPSPGTYRIRINRLPFGDTVGNLKLGLEVMAF